MKVGLLTLRFHSNFGFLMQAYALQKAVKKLGHEPYHFYIKEEPVPLFEKIVIFFKRLARNLFWGAKYQLFPYYPTNSDRMIKDKNTWNFINDNISLSPYIPSLKTKYAKKIPLYDAYIVGSDQVWRKEFTEDIRCYFFSFAPQGSKKMSYAASFGKNTISYSNRIKRECKNLLKEFSYVTVREDDGIRMCKEYFDCDSTMVVDPTLLLTSEDYSLLIKDPDTLLDKEPYVFTYILRPNKEKLDFINRFAKDRHLKVINIMPKVLEKVGKKHLSECVYPSISTWLKGFSQAEFVITDSFHATVFSIIFHRQFYVVNDNYGGKTRIPSLLNSLGISGRYSCDYNDIIISIEYDEVEKILKSRRKTSIEILSDFLNS